MARCVGLKRDLRLSWKENYSGYNNIFLKSYLTHNGDSYDRFLIRMFEMGESLNVSNQCVSTLLKLSRGNEYSYNTIKCHSEISNNYTKKVKQSLQSYKYMEDLIEHFVN